MGKGRAAEGRSVYADHEPLVRDRNLENSGFEPGCHREAELASRVEVFATHVAGDDDGWQHRAPLQSRDDAFDAAYRARTVGRSLHIERIRQARRLVEQLVVDAF